MRAILKLLLIACYALVPLVPLIGLALLDMPATHLGRPMPDRLASGLAMTGFALVFLEYMVLSRLRLVDRFFDCGQIMRVHQLFARTACGFLIAHPFLYSLWGSVSATGKPGPAALGIAGESLLTGTVAWVALLALVLLAIRRHEPGHEYDRWRRGHMILAIVVIVAGLHHTLHAGLYASLPWLRAYWWCLFVLAIGVNVWLYLVSPWRQSRLPYRLMSHRRSANRICAITLVPEHDSAVSPRPGQFYWIKRASPWAYHDHPFSVAGIAPDGRSLTFLIKQAGDFTQALQTAACGELFFLDGPYGSFQIAPTSEPVVMIAGGIGAAPILSLLQECDRRGDQRRILVLFAAQTADDMVHPPEIDRARCPHLVIEMLVEEPSAQWQHGVGRCDGDHVVSACKRHGIDLISPQLQVMICGPAVMADSIETALTRAGVAAGSLHTERYRHELGEDSPIARRSVRHWLMSSLAMLGALLALVFAMR